MNIGRSSLVGFSNFESLANSGTFHNNFLLFLFAKLGRRVVPTKLYDRENVVDYWILALQWWDSYEAKKKKALRFSSIYGIISSLVISLKFGHFRQII